MRSLYYFDDSDVSESDLVGGKGLSLMRMSRLHLNVPYGFILSPRIWKQYKTTGTIPETVKQEIRIGITQIEKRSGKQFGNTTNPLILSARSGAKFSMPGMMESILNIGITQETLTGLIDKLGREEAQKTYLHFLHTLGTTVLRIDSHLFQKVPGDDLEHRITLYRGIIQSHTSLDLDDPIELLFQCIMTVFDSFDNSGAVEYRNSTGIPHDIGTAVIIQQMVFGNKGMYGGSAVVFSRNMDTGKQELTGNFLMQAQGDDVVKGYTLAKPLTEMPHTLIESIRSSLFLLEKEWKNVVDVEITWEDYHDSSHIFFLQCRPMKMPPHRYFTVQEELVKDGVRTVEDVLGEVPIYTVYQSRIMKFTPPNNKIILCTGSALHTGYGIGTIVTSVMEAKKRLANREAIVLLCPHFDPNDLELLTGSHRLQAVIASQGSPASHMGLVLSALNIPGIIGIHTKKTPMEPGMMVSVDAEEGIVYEGAGSVEPQQKNGFSEIISKQWIARNGHQNAWADFINTKQLVKVETEIHARVAEIAKRYNSKKARQTAVINECFEPPTRIYTDIIKAEKKDLILQCAQTIKEEGKGLWLRSAYEPDYLQAPYTSADLTRISPELVEQWLRGTHEDAHISRFGPYPTWLRITDSGVQYDMQYALLQHDEQGKLDGELFPEHFVCNIRCESGMPTRVLVDIFDGSPHTRELGQRSYSHIMTIVIVGNKSLQSKIGKVYFKFGRRLFNQDLLIRYQTMTELLARLTTIGQQPQNVHDFVWGVNKLSENNQISRVELAHLIQPRKWDIIQYVSSTIIHEWWKKYDLPTRMWALHKLTGAGVLEVQGRYTPTTKWIKIYGTKGEEERNLATLRS